MLAPTRHGSSIAGAVTFGGRGYSWRLTNGFRMQNASKDLKAVDDPRTGAGEIGVGIDHVDAVIARGVSS